MDSSTEAKVKEVGVAMVRASGDSYFLLSDTRQAAWRRKSTDLLKTVQQAA
ncbi:hypothetical protein ACX80N_12425 [Arthrobacter sp. MDT2-16]